MDVWVTHTNGEIDRVGVARADTPARLDRMARHAMKYLAESAGDTARHTGERGRADDDETDATDASSTATDRSSALCPEALAALAVRPW